VVDGLTPPLKKSILQYSKIETFNNCLQPQNCLFVGYSTVNSIDECTTPLQRGKRSLFE